MRTLLLYLLFLNTAVSFGQTYYPFPDSVGVWREVQFTGDVIADPPEVRLPYTFFINGDTIIDSNTYSKLYYYSCNPVSYFTPGFHPIPICINIDTSNSTYFGAIKEVNKKIYFYPDTTYNNGNGYWFCYEWSNPSQNYSQDLLLYDFDVNVGDTVFYPHLNNSYLVISSIDSILIQSQFRKRYNFSLSSFGNCFPSSYSYVEGIGNIDQGLFGFYWYYFERSHVLSCFEDNEIQYPDSNGCSPTGIKENELDNNLKIYPNPTIHQLTIELNEIDKKFQPIMTIFSIDGKSVYSSLLLNSINTIDISTLEKGVYLVKIELNNGNSKSTLVSIN